eukprot:jgi/Chrzof1/12971/Cz07g14140.t1
MSATAAAAAADHDDDDELLQMSRLDSYYAWLPWPVENSTVQLQEEQTTPSTINYNGCWVLVPSPAHCRHTTRLQGNGSVSSGSNHKHHATYAQLIQRLQAAGAGGVMMYDTRCQGDDIDNIKPQGPADESLDLHIPATMISYASGMRLKRIIQASDNQTAAITFKTLQVPGFFLAIDGQHKLAEVGWLQIPYLIHLAWAAQWLQYTSKLHKRLRREDEDGQGSLVIPLFEGAPLSPDGGYLRRSIKLPPLQQLKAYKHFSVEMALTCGGGGLDRDCPAWDHVIQMFVCCDDPPGGRPCDPCAITPWLVAGSRSRPNMYPRHPDSEAQGDIMSHTKDALHHTPSVYDGSTLCGRELARWVTPFRRRVGHWITDVTHLRGLITSERCLFQVQAPPWAGDWVPNINLRCTHRHHPPSESQPKSHT